jgi:hypothetical protein
MKDTLSDCQLSLIFFDEHERNKINDRGLLEELEDHINEIIFQIYWMIDILIFLH